MNQPEPKETNETQGGINYALILEDSVKAGHLLVYWGYAVFNCNFNDPKYPSKSFVVMYARGVTDEFFTYGTPGYFIGTAARDINRGESIVWNPERNTGDVIVKGRAQHMLMKGPELPKNIFVTSEPEPQPIGKAGPGPDNQITIGEDGSPNHE